MSEEKQTQKVLETRFAADNQLPYFLMEDGSFRYMIQDYGYGIQCLTESEIKTRFGIADDGSYIGRPEEKKWWQFWE